MIITLTRGQAADKYGPEFVRMLMRGKKEIQIGPQQRILLEKWKLIRKLKFAPFAYEYVYVVSNGDREFKVGVTYAPRNRLTSLKTGTTADLKIVGLFVVGGQQGRNLERGIHAEYKRRGRHVRGEWFSGKAEDEIASIADFAKANYSHGLVSLSQAWGGCEPLVDLYVAAHVNTPHAVDVKKCRSEFLWIVEQAEKGALTVLS